MAITTERIIGRDITLSDGTAYSRWLTCQVTETTETPSATAADSIQGQAVFTTRQIEGTITGYLGAASVGSGGYLPLLGDAVTFTATVGADSIRDFSGYDDVKVTSVQMSLQGDPATYSISFRSGMLNSPGSLS